MADVQEPIGGVSLDAYAVVRASLAEGLPPAEAHAAARVDEAAWPAADLGWKLRFAEPGGTPLLDRYRARLAVAEDALARKVPPLDDDPAAWIAFLAAFGAAAEPAAVLDRTGIGPNDLARLGRAWERKIARDAALAKKIEDLRKQAPGAVPVVRPGPLAGASLAAAVLLDARDAAPPSRAQEPKRAPSAPPAPLPGTEESPAVSTPVVPSYLREPARPQPSFVRVEPAAEPTKGPVSPPAEDSPVRKSARHHHFARTVEASNAPAGPALPFGPPNKPPGGRSARHHHFARTVEATDGPLAPALPFATAPKASPSTPPPVSLPPASLPPASAPAAAPQSTPPFPMERYASLTVELAEYPAHAAAVLHRYGLTAEQKAQLDTRFGAELTKPEARIAFDQACAAYRTWLRSKR